MHNKLLDKTFLICISGGLFSPIALAQELKRDTTHTRGVAEVQSDEIRQSAPLPYDTIRVDSTRADRPKMDTLKPGRGRLEAEVKYTAVDSIDYNLSEGKTYLVNQASITYKDMNLKAGHIIIDWARNMVYAYGMTDTTGNTVQKPVLTQGEEVIHVDTIAYNIQTKKSVIQAIRTQAQQGILYGDLVKRFSDSLYYIRSGKYTTDTALVPDYYISAQRIKYMPGDKLITGPAQMYIHQTPTPLVLPFGYFPTSSSKRSGVIIPQWGSESDSGFFLQGLGYYLALSDYIDLEARFDIHSKGSYGMRVNSNYKLRYRFDGNLYFDYRNDISGTRGLKDYSRALDYEFKWTHNQDEKANPNFRVSASVDLSSSRYFKDSRLLEDVLSRRDLINNNQSTISLTKTFDNFPFRINLGIEHSQNLNTKHIDMTLPSLSIDMDRRYPFAPKVGSRKGILRNLSIGYALRAENKLSLGDSSFFHKEMFDSAQVGAQHSLEISTSAELLHYLSWTVGGHYTENWGIETTNKFYNPKKDKVEEQRERGVASFRTFGFQTNLSTTVYGIKEFKKGGFIQAIRHSMTPTVSFSYHPDFWSDFWGYTRFYRDRKGKRQPYTPFENFPYGGPDRGMSGSIGFGLDNNLEAKVRSKTDTGEYKKVSLLERLNFSSSYDLAADSFPLGNISVSAATTLLKGLNLTFDPVFNPYKVVDCEKIDRLTTPWLESFVLNMDYSMDNTTFGKKERDADEGTEEGVFTYDSEGYAHYAIPWNLGVHYSFNYNSNRTSRTKTTHTHTLNFDGNIEFSPFWKVGFSYGAYDFSKNEFTPPSLHFERQLRSFTIDFNWTPSGPQASYYFLIRLNSDILKDLKYDRRRFPERNNTPF